jgi:hypothetical protein
MHSELYFGACWSAAVVQLVEQLTPDPDGKILLMLDLIENCKIIITMTS